jgi:ankyrin repeat protein
MHIFLGRPTALLLITLAWSIPGFCGEIHTAAFKGDLQKVRKLLIGNPELISSQDDDENTPLHMAAISGNKYVTKSLLAHGADVNSKDSNGATPLHDALIGPLALRQDVVELLRRHGGHE